MPAPVVGELVRDVLGNERAVARTWEDGSWACPLCTSAVAAERGETACANPWCVANPAMPVEAARRIYADAAARERERKERERNAHWSRERVEREALERAEQRASVRAQAEERGACVFCAMKALAGGRQVRYVRHRGVCPDQRG